MEMMKDYYLLSLIVIYFFYFLVYLGVLTSLPEIVDKMNFAVHLFLCFFLMYSYHPFRSQYHFHSNDARFIFGAAFLLLTNIISTSFVENTLSFLLPEGQIKQQLNALLNIKNRS